MRNQIICVLKIPKTIGKDIYVCVSNDKCWKNKLFLYQVGPLSFLFIPEARLISRAFFFQCQLSRYFYMLLAGAFLRKKYVSCWISRSFLFLQCTDGWWRRLRERRARLVKQKNNSAGVELMIAVYLWGRETIENISEFNCMKF